MAPMVWSRAHPLLPTVTADASLLFLCRGGRRRRAPAVSLNIGMRLGLVDKTAPSFQPHALSRGPSRLQTQQRDRVSRLPWKTSLLATTESVHLLAQLKRREAHLPAQPCGRKRCAAVSAGSTDRPVPGLHEENTKCYLADQQHCGIARCASLYRRFHLAPWVIYPGTLTPSTASSRWEYRPPWTGVFRENRQAHASPV